MCGDNSIDWCHLGFPNLDIYIVMNHEYTIERCAFSLMTVLSHFCYGSFLNNIKLHIEILMIIHKTCRGQFYPAPKSCLTLIAENSINITIEGPSCHPMQLPALDQDSRNTGTAVWIFDIFSPAAWVAGPALYDRAAGSVGDLAAASRPAPGHGNKEQSRVSPPPGREHRLSSLQPGHCETVTDG